MGDEMVVEIDETEKIGDEGENYFGLDRPMSPSSAKSILEDAEIWKWKKEHPEPPKKETAIGSATHCLLLEPEKFDDKFIVREDVPVNKSTQNPFGRTSQKFKDWYAGVEHLLEGKILIMPNEFQELKLIQKKYNNAVDMIVAIGKKKYPDSKIEHEREINWIDPVTNHPCKGIIDSMCGNIIMDLKTTGDLSNRTITNKINYEYHIQAAAYADALQQVDGIENPRVYFMFMLSKPPYNIRIKEVTEDVLENGLLEFRRGIALYRNWAKAGFPAIYRGIEIEGLTPYRIHEIQAANGKR